MKSYLILAMLVLLGITIAFLVQRDAKEREGIDKNLLVAVKGNKGLAKRLLNHARLKYPGKSDRWYVEKVIYDLERDGAGSKGYYPRGRLNNREIRENIYMVGSLLFLINMVSSFVEGLFRGR